MKNYRAEQKERAEAIAESRAKNTQDKKELYRLLFNSDAGKKVLIDLIGFTQYGEDVFESCPDERTNTYIQGRQSVIIHIKKILED